MIVIFYLLLFLVSLELAIRYLVKSTVWKENLDSITLNRIAGLLPIDWSFKPLRLSSPLELFLIAHFTTLKYYITTKTLLTYPINSWLWIRLGRNIRTIIFCFLKCLFKYISERIHYYQFEWVRFWFVKVLCTILDEFNFFC